MNLDVNGYDDWFLGSWDDYGLALANTLIPLWPASSIHNVVWTSNTYWSPGDSGEDYEFIYAMNRFYNGSMSNKAPKDFSGGRSVWPIRKF